MEKDFIITYLPSCGGTPHPNLPPQGGKVFTEHWSERDAQHGT